MNEFKSQICTSIEQSKRLLDLGLKPETADCFHWNYSGVYYVGNITEKLEPEDVPAWSLHRLIELYKDAEDASMWSLEYVNYNRLIQCIKLAIKHGAFNKEYLKQ